MANLFHHHAQNDLVRIENGTQCYVDRVAAFVADNGALPPLPAEAIERIYEPGTRHSMSNGTAVIGAGPQPWPFGDAAIAAVSSLLAAQAKRIAAPPKPTPEVPQVNKTGKSSGTATMAS